MSPAATSTATRTLDPATLGDHVDRLYRAAWALSGHRQDAEDLVQETYARVLARPRLLRHDDDLGYLLRVMRNVFISGLRTKTRRPQTAALPDDFEAIDHRAGLRPVEAVEAREVFGVIAGLPGGVPRRAGRRRRRGLSYREAARLLNTKEATITSRLHRARARVAAGMEPAPAASWRSDEAPRARGSPGGARRCPHRPGGGHDERAADAAQPPARAGPRAGGGGPPTATPSGWRWPSRPRPPPPPRRRRSSCRAALPARRRSPRPPPSARARRPRPRASPPATRRGSRCAWRARRSRPGSASGWTPTGTRTDSLHGRRAATVFYAAPDGTRVAYTIVGGKTLAGTPSWEHAVRTEHRDGRWIVTWERDGKTCVLTAPDRFAVQRLELRAAGS